MNDKLRIRNDKLRIMNYELEMTNDKLRIMNYESEKISTVANFATTTTHNVIKRNIERFLMILCFN